MIEGGISIILAIYFCERWTEVFPYAILNADRLTRDARG
jgi:hypothetical protein